MSKFKVEVIADSSGKWVGNGRTFDTREEAEAHAKDLYSRWTSVTRLRVIPVSRLTPAQDKKIREVAERFSHPIPEDSSIEDHATDTTGFLLLLPRENGKGPCGLPDNWVEVTLPNNFTFGVSPEGDSAS